MFKNRQMDNQIWTLHTTEDYSAITRNEALTRAKTWVILANVKLVKETRQRDMYELLMRNVQNREIKRQGVDYCLLRAGVGVGDRER